MLLCLLNLFFWQSSIEVTLLYFALDNFFFYFVFFNLDLLCCWLICIFVCNLITHWQASKKKRNICGLNKFCLFFYLYIFEVTHLKLAFLIYIYIYIYIYIKYILHIYIYKRTLPTGFYIQWRRSVYITYIMCQSSHLTSAKFEHFVCCRYILWFLFSLIFSVLFVIQ